jgi:predicted XRE-type DNA-binding protein
MIDIIYQYKALLDNIDSMISESRFKKEYVIEQLGISRASYYNKVKKKSFSIAEMITLITLLFPEEAKAYEIQQALKNSRKESAAGTARCHNDVMNDLRSKLQA